MDPATGAAIGEIGGAVVGEVVGRGDRRAARRARERALAMLMGIEEEAGPSAFENEDPAARDNLLRTMTELRGIYDEGGLDAGARADLAEAQAQNAARERMSREAITQDAASRGISGSGAELAAKLQAGQSGANRNAAAGTRVAADSRGRAINALLSSADTAGTLRSGDFQKAGGMDAMSQFNASQRLRKGGMMAGAETNYADSRNADADARRFDYGQIGGTVGTLVGSKKKREDENTYTASGG